MNKQTATSQKQSPIDTLHQDALLIARGITKTFTQGGNKLNILNNLDLKLDGGEIAALVGPSGSGKSTLLQILGLLDKPTSGSLQIGDKNASKLGDKARTNLRLTDIGFVYQFHHLLPEFNALENVAMPQIILGVKKAEAHEKAAELLNALGLKDRVTHRPSQLSGGEQQRVAIARALVNEPKLLFADEPTGNLDLGNANRLIDLFKKINTDFNQAFVITTHNPEVASIGKKKYYLGNGSLSPTDKF